VDLQFVVTGNGSEGNMCGVQRCTRWDQHLTRRGLFAGMADVLTGQWLAVLSVVVERQQELALSVVGELATFCAEYRVGALRYQSTGGNGAGFVA
jgi:hypothetical protein